MNEKPLIVLDVDGTLVGKNCRLNPFTENYLRHLSHLGIMIVLASGRPYRSIAPYYEKLDCFGPVICYNGALCFHPKDKDFPPLRFPFPKEIIRKIALESKGIVTSLMCESEHTIYISRVDHYLDHYFPYEGMKIIKGNIEEILKEDPYTCLLRSSHKRDKELSSICSQYKEISHRHWHASFYSELHIEEANKGACLRYVQDQYGFSKENTYAFGDAENDISMLKEAGYPFAMADSKSSLLKERFPNTEKGASGNGVALMLKKLGF